MVTCSMKKMMAMFATLVALWTLCPVTAFAAVNPATGDTMNIILFVGIAVVSLGLIVFLLMGKKKKK